MGKIARKKSRREEFTTFTISKKLGIKYGRLREWIDRGFAKPSLKRAKGVGSKSLFSRLDVYLIKLFDCLIERGFSRQDAGEMINRLSSSSFAEFELAPKEFLQYRYNFIGVIRKNNEVSPFIIHKFTISQKRENPESRVRTMDSSFSSVLTEDTDDCFIVNFKAIRDEVDKALA